MAVLGVRFTKEKRVKLAQILWILNWISVVSGLLLFSLGTVLKVELRRRADLMVEGGAGLHSLPNLLMGVGLLACVINLLGGKICHDFATADSAKVSRWRLVLLPYTVCALVFTACLLAGGLMCYGARGALDGALRAGLRNAMHFYRDTDVPGRCFIKRSIDLLQMEFHCCGNSGFRDWFELQWISVRYLDMASKDVRDRLKSNVDGKFLVDGVPFSCCNPNSPRACIQQGITNSSAHYNYDYLSEELNLWMRGCREALLEHYTGILAYVGLTVLLVWLFELSVLVGVRYMQTAMENALLAGDPDCECEGWLLESGLAETARSNFNVIKSLGKSNQIDSVMGKEDPNLDVPVPPVPAHYGPRDGVAATGRHIPLDS
ncbi:unnamed protein product [Lampetra fluviatilis]